MYQFAHQIWDAHKLLTSYRLVNEEKNINLQFVRNVSLCLHFYEICHTSIEKSVWGIEISIWGMQTCDIQKWHVFLSKLQFSGVQKFYFCNGGSRTSAVQKGKSFWEFIRTLQFRKIYVNELLAQQRQIRYLLNHAENLREGKSCLMLPFHCS